MNLIIDVGNSFIKMAVFEDGIIQHKITTSKEEFLDRLKEIDSNYPQIENAILSSVGGFSEKEIARIKKVASLLVLSHEINLPFKNEYATPKTLGVDRIALVSAAAAQFPKEHVLVIDAGSCITYDFLNSENTYLGGAISPGMRMRYKSMNSFTANLPLLETENPDQLVGTSTEESMHVGVVQGVINELEGFISAYIENFTTLTVILTGGDAHFLRDSIKNDIFANSNFLLEGLNHILEINKHTC